jgi:hypothetical protein
VGFGTHILLREDQKVNHNTSFELLILKLREV